MKINLIAILIVTNLFISGCSKNVCLTCKDRQNPIVAFVDDKTLAVQAATNISKDKELWQESHISILSHNNTILLVGQTPSITLKQRAEKIIGDMPNVTTIYNQLVIAKPSSIIDRTKDTWITTQVKAKLLAEKDLASYNIKVITESGVVYLMGNPQEKDNGVAINIARNIDGVTKVVDVFSMDAN